MYDAEIRKFRAKRTPDQWSVQPTASGEFYEDLQHLENFMEILQHDTADRMHPRSSILSCACADQRDARVGAVTGGNIHNGPLDTSLSQDKGRSRKGSLYCLYSGCLLRKVKNPWAHTIRTAQLFQLWGLDLDNHGASGESYQEAAEYIGSSIGYHHSCEDHRCREQNLDGG